LYKPVACCHRTMTCSWAFLHIVFWAGYSKSI
jgi:hypothetical protein